MEQQDYLKKQIDQLGRILGKMLADFIGLKNKGQINDGIEITNQALKSELDIDIYELIEIPDDEFINTLKSNKNLTNENLSKLVEIIFHVAENSPDLNKNLYEKCLIMYEYLEKDENIYSLDRKWKMERIKNML